MMRSFFLIAAMMLLAAPVHAEGIAAVVNSDIVTTTDLQDRAEMLLKSSGKPAGPEMIRRVQSQVLEGLIAESVQLQEVRKQRITVSDEEVKDAFKKIAENNKFSEQQFRDILAKQGVRASSIERQIRAQIGWGKVIQQVLRSRVIVGTSEIAAERARMADSKGKQEYLAAEIFLPVSGAGDDAKVRALAQTIVGELRKGKPFPELAREYSQSASAAQGGQIGWVQEGQLETAINNTILNLPKNKPSDVVKGEDGYYIMYVRDSRAASAASPDDAILKIRVLSIDTTGKSERDARAEAERISQDLTGCLDIARVAASDRRFKMAEHEVAISELTASDRQRLGNFDIGRATAPGYFSNTQATISMVCDRSDPKGPMANDAVLERKLGLQRLDMLQKRYLRDLISAAYIERRV